MGSNDVFAVLADKTRRGILTALKDGERPVGDLVVELGVSQPTVPKHLKILREAGMVSMEAQGQRRLYAVRPEPLTEVTDWIGGVVGGIAATGAPVVDPAGAVEAEPAGADPVGAEPVTTTGAEALPPAPVPRRPAPTEPEPPATGTAQRSAGGAGTRAAGILSTLSGLRRRPRHPRR